MARVGVLRPLEHVGRAALLDDLALAHDVDAVGHRAHDAEVVRDQQHGHAELALQVLQQLEDLRLDGDVERRGRLVGDQQVGLVGERHGDHHALALAAGELMRVGVRAAAPGRRGRPCAAARARARAPWHRRAPWCSFMTSPTCFSMVCSGLSEVIGSWKMIEIFSPRSSRMAWPGALSRSLPPKWIAPVGCEADGIGQQPQDRQRRDGLARARTRRPARRSRPWRW